MDKHLQSHLKLLSSLIGPVESWSVQDEPHGTVLDDILRIKLEEYQQQNLTGDESANFDNLNINQKPELTNCDET